MQILKLAQQLKFSFGSMDLETLQQQVFLRMSGGHLVFLLLGRRLLPLVDSSPRWQGHPAGRMLWKIS